MRFFFVSLLFCTLSFLISCGPGSNDAAAYNDKLIEEQNKVANKGEAFFTALDGAPADMEKAFSEFKAQVTGSLKVTVELGPFEGDTSFQAACVRALTLQQGFCENEYKTIVSLLSKPDDEITEEDTDQYGKLIAEIDAQQKKAMAELDASQQAFAKTWNFTIDPTKTFGE